MEYIEGDCLYVRWKSKEGHLSVKFYPWTFEGRARMNREMSVLRADGFEVTVELPIQRNIDAVRGLARNGTVLQTDARIGRPGE